MVLSMRDDMDCVIPAAGTSTRMGRWKPMLSWGRKTVVETTVENALAVCSRVILVTGHRTNEIGALFEHRPEIVITANPDFSEGLFSSIQTGVRLVTTRRFFVTLADMPLISPEVYQTLLSASVSDVVRPYCHGSKGHPVLIGSHLIQNILTLPPSASMAEVIRRVSVVRVETEDPSVFLDLDDPADYERLRPRNSVS
jgi:molybdenum cofactor cytidylyltransferase